MLSCMEAGQTPGSSPPAGWYPDPQNQNVQRYWDGAAWTEHVHPPPGGQPGPQSPGGQAGPQSPGYQAGPQAPGYQGPAGPMVAGTADANARQWAVFAHLSALIGLITGLMWLGPLIIYLVKKDDHPYIADQGREALNFNISVFIYLVVGSIAAVILTLVLIGLLLIPVVIAIAIAWLVLVVIAAVKANSGEMYRYPLTIRFVS